MVCTVVPTWDGAHLLQPCLESLRAQVLPDGWTHRVVVVDNGSVDVTLELLATSFPDVDVVALPTNLGFAGGCNAGAVRAGELGAEVLALLNNDAAADPGWLAALLDELGQHPEAAVVAGASLQPDRRTFDTAGDCWTTYGLAYPRGRGEPVDGRYGAADQREVLAASGGSCAYRLAAFASAGGFCDDFVAYWEDLDLCLRLRLAGWTVRYAPGAVSVHAQGATSSRMPGFAQFSTSRNRVLVWVRCLPGPLMRRTWRRYLVGWLWQLVSDARMRRLRPTLRGLAAAARRMPRTLRERRAIQAGAVVPADEIARWIVDDWPPESPGKHWRERAARVRAAGQRAVARR